MFVNTGKLSMNHISKNCKTCLDTDMAKTAKIEKACHVEIQILVRTAKAESILVGCIVSIHVNADRSNERKCSKHPLYSNNQRIMILGFHLRWQIDHDLDWSTSDEGSPGPSADPNCQWGKSPIAISSCEETWWDMTKHWLMFWNIYFSTYPEAPKCYP